MMGHLKKAMSADGLTKKSSATCLPFDPCVKQNQHQDQKINEHQLLNAIFSLYETHNALDANLSAVLKVTPKRSY